ncbi:MAG: type II toxin-antitoxin system PemK/MazF family toxin [Candidatus Diapherotrites archaeon]|nr:type II toxin-antitoxin system PemK/MazF family toxin [Candidatus Diapherotrites archaeon]
MFDQKDIILLPFPFTNLSASKTRPALIISNSKFNSISDDVICCVITKVLVEAVFGVLITEKDVFGGRLFFKSRIKPYRLFTADRNMIQKKLCSLSNNKFDEVIAILRELTAKE